jgi:hypothetical protein
MYQMSGMDMAKDDKLNTHSMAVLTFRFILLKEKALITYRETPKSVCRPLQLIAQGDRTNWPTPEADP